MRFSRFLAIALLALSLVSGAAAATRAGSTATLDRAARAARLPAPGRRPAAGHVHADAVVRVAARRRREALRVPARDRADVRVGRAARPQDGDHAHRLARDRPAVDHRHALLALRARARGRAGRADEPVEHALRLQRPVDDAADAARGARRARALDDGRRRHGVPGLVPGAEHDLQDADERRRRARVLQLPPGPVLDRRRALAHPRGARPLRRRRDEPRAERPARDLVRALEPRVHVDEHAVRRRIARSRRDDLRRDLDRDDAHRAPPHARVLVQRRHDRERNVDRALPRLRGNRQGLRERRLPRSDRRQSGVRAALERDARAAVDDRRADRVSHAVRLDRRGGSDEHGRLDSRDRERGHGVERLGHDHERRGRLPGERRHRRASDDDRGDQAGRVPGRDARGRPGQPRAADRPLGHRLADRAVLLDGRPRRRAGEVDAHDEPRLDRRGRRDDGVDRRRRPARGRATSSRSEPARRRRA